MSTAKISEPISGDKLYQVFEKLVVFTVLFIPIYAIKLHISY